MSATKRVTADKIQRLAFDHHDCCDAVLEFEGAHVYLSLRPSHGGEFVAEAAAEVTA